MHSLILDEAPRKLLTLMTENPEHGGLPNTTSAGMVGHAFAGSPTCASQSYPSRCLFARQFGTPNPPGSSHFPTSLKPAWVMPRANPPANPITSTALYVTARSYQAGQLPDR